MSSLSWEHAVEMRHALTVIVTDPDYGVSALSNVRTMTNLLNDLLPDAPREKSALIGAADARVSEILLDRIAQGMDPRLAINQAASALAAATVFPSDVCDSVTREIATAIGIRQVEADTVLPRPAAGARSPARCESRPAGDQDHRGWRAAGRDHQATATERDSPARSPARLAATRGTGSHRRHGGRRGRRGSRRAVHQVTCARADQVAADDHENERGPPARIALRAGTAAGPEGDVSEAPPLLHRDQQRDRRPVGVSVHWPCGLRRGRPAAE